MSLFHRIAYFLRITDTHGIARRYFVVNGFDGALTMLGLVVGFVVSESTDLAVIISACLGAAIALGISGVSSAYVSEAAELRRELEKLEGAMVTDLQDSAHGKAVRWVPFVIAFVNGMAPLSISILIITPLWLADAGVALPFKPLYVSIVVSLFLIFLLGVFLGRISNVSWIMGGLRTLSVALVTAFLIFLFAGA